jgi:hypothetical protein
MELGNRNCVTVAFEIPWNNLTKSLFMSLREAFGDRREPNATKQSVQI